MKKSVVLSSKKDWVDKPSEGPKIISHMGTTKEENKLIGKLAEQKGALPVFIDSGEYKNLYLFHNKKAFQEYKP